MVKILLQVKKTAAHFDELQFEEFRHVVCLCDPEDDANDVLRGIAQRPQMGHDFVGCIYVAVNAVLQHVLHQHWMRLIAYLKAIHLNLLP